MTSRDLALSERLVVGSREMEIFRRRAQGFSIERGSQQGIAIIIWFYAVIMLL